MANEQHPKLAELTAIIKGIQDRVRSQNPQGQVANLSVPLPDLHPIMHARDSAEGKAASIGTVNPRPPGLLNASIQTVKRTVSRGLGWFVRDQVEFNRAAIGCIDAILTALNEANRTIVALNHKVEQLRADNDRDAQGLRAESKELKDIRSHWIQWREEWQHKLKENEIYYLRAAADLQAGFQHRALLMEDNFRESIKSQHGEFTAAMEKGIVESQQRFWQELDKVRTEYERVIHNELRVARQRAMAQSSTLQPAAEPPMDYTRFADQFRGPEAHVRTNQKVYEPYFQGRRNVLDAGCGRGEFLEFMRQMNVPSHGIDLDPESVGYCVSKGLIAEQADLFEHLAKQPAGSLDGIFSSQVVEHLPPPRVPEMIRLAAQALDREGLLVIETPNPESLAIFATHFYLDPTHQKPIPPGLLVFYFEEAGFGRIEVLRLSPAIESMPSLASLPEDFRNTFFGALDYAVIGRKL